MFHEGCLSVEPEPNPTENWNPTGILAGTESGTLFFELVEPESELSRKINNGCRFTMKRFNHPWL